MTTVDQVLSGLDSYRSEGRFRTSASDAVEVALSSLANRAVPQVRDFAVTDRGVSLSIVSSNTTSEVAVDDVVEAGLALQYGAAPEEGMSVSAFFHRLRCLNGMTHRECGSPARILRAPNDRHLKDVEQLVGALWSRLPSRLDEMRALTRTRAAVPSLLEDSTRRAGLSPRRLMPRLLQAWNEEEAVATEFGALNALTRVATHAHDLPRVERDVLSQAAGALAFRASHSCSRCMPELNWRNSGFMRELTTFVVRGLRPTPAQ